MNRPPQSGGTLQRGLLDFSNGTSHTENVTGSTGKRQVAWPIELMRCLDGTERSLLWIADGMAVWFGFVLGFFLLFFFFFKESVLTNPLYKGWTTVLTNNVLSTSLRIQPSSHDATRQWVGLS